MLLEELPVELLNAVSGYLEPSEWGSLRLTCKPLYKKSLEAFARQYCKSITALITYDGLHKLEYLAANDDFRSEIKELWIVPNLFERHYYDFTEDEPWDCRLELQRILSNQCTILESGDLEERLSRCMRRFENLEVVGLRPCSKEFLLSREKDTGFLCLGLRQIRYLLPYVKLSPYSHEETSEMVVRDIRRGHLFSALLNAMATCTQNLRRLHTCNGFECGLAPEDIYLTESEYEALLPSLQGLEHLHMCLHNVRDYPDAVRLKGILDVLLTAAPNLMVLKFSQKTRSAAIGRFLGKAKHQILDPRYFLETSQRIQFTQLVELHLDGIDITQSAIKSFLHSAAPSLKSLRMSALSLNDIVPSLGDPKIIVQLNDKIRGEAKELWRQVWNFFRDELSLQFLSMEHLSYRNHWLPLRDNTVPTVPQAKRAKREPASFDMQQSELPFEDWIDQLDFMERPYHDSDLRRMMNSRPR